LRLLLDAHPEISEYCADLAARTESDLIALIAGTNQLAAEILARELAARRSGLEGATPSPLERMLVSSICLSWLQHNYLARLLCHSQGMSARHARDLGRRQAAVGRQYLAGLRTLILVRQHLHHVGKGDEEKAATGRQAGN
jgi:hypothetical protein